MRPQHPTILIKLTDTDIVTYRSTIYELPDDGLIKTGTCRSICYIF